MRLIDADAIPFRDELKRLSVLDHDKYITAETLEYMLEHAPTVDAVPVIRCKDCRHLVRYNGALVCSEPNGMMTFSPDGFCSYGQRREEERRDNDHTR